MAEVNPNGSVVGGSPRKLWVPGLVLALALALRLGFFAVSLGGLPVTSDESLTVLQAKQISHGHAPLLFMSVPYSFPVESYLMAPLVRLMPRTPFGARWLVFLLGLATLAAAALLARLWLGRCHSRLPLLLVLFPSAYLLILQAAYALPFYGPLMLYSALAPLLAFLSRRESPRAALWLCLAAFLCGLAISNYLGSLPLMAVVLAYLVLTGSPRDSARRALWAMPSFALGLAPYLIVTWRFHYSSALSGTFHAGQVLRRIWSPLLPHALGGALGFDPPLFTDFETTLYASPALRSLGCALFLLVLGAATLRTTREFLAGLARSRWPRLETQDIFIGGSWLCLAVFVLSIRAHSTTYRYLIIAVCSFPFVLGYLMAGAGRTLRTATVLVAFLLVGWNGFTTLGLMRRWAEPGFAVGEARAPDLGPAVSLLEGQGIRHCYATFALAYRVDFLTDERIVCRETLDPRFPGWPVPYAEEVDAARDVAYLLSGKVRLFHPREFEDSLATHDADFRKQQAGDVTVYYDFRERGSGPPAPVSGGELAVRAELNQDVAGKLVDGRLDTYWRSGRPQRQGDGVEIRLQRPRELSRITLFSGGDTVDQPARVDLRARIGGTWKMVLGDQPLAGWTAFEFRNGHPAPGDIRVWLDFPPLEADALRLEISLPRPPRDWVLSELQLSGPAP